MPLSNASSPNASHLPPCSYVSCESLARTLLTESTLQHLEPFTQGPRSLAELARDTGEPLYKCRRNVLRLVKQGILEMQRTEKRAGRPIKYYGLTHTDFFIPLQIIPIETMLELTEASINARLNRNLARELVELQGIGGYHVHLEHGNSGVLMAHEPFVRWHPTEHSDAVMHLRWLTLKLDHAQAKQLQNELAEVLTRYMPCQGPQEYLVALKMVAVRE